MEAAVQMRQERMKNDCDNAGVPVSKEEEGGTRKVPAHLLVRSWFVHIDGDGQGRGQGYGDVR